VYKLTGVTKLYRKGRRTVPAVSVPAEANWPGFGNRDACRAGQRCLGCQA
jgi:hypothetical protein